MVHTTCAIRDCLSSSYINKDLRFHRMPRGEERCKLWVIASKRPDFVGRSFESLKNTYVCSLHFEKGMYARKALKKTAIPTLLLPNKESVQTQTDVTIEILNDIVLNYVPDERRIVKQEISEEYHELAGSSSQAGKHTDTKQSGIESSVHTPAQLTDHTTRKRKLRKELFKTSKKLKCVDKCEDITENQFLNGCDKFLSPKFSEIVKAQINGTTMTAWNFLLG